MSEALARDRFLSQIVYGANGLVPVVVQDHCNGTVLMLAWMNRETLALTLETGDLTYWSRSRNEVWRKGATSGNTQRLVEAWIDCDGDALLMKVAQRGPACHTGAPSCFFRKVER